MSTILLVLTNNNDGVMLVGFRHLHPEWKNMVIKSEVQRNTLNPEFHENFVFPLTEQQLAQKTLFIEVLAHNRKGRDAFLGMKHLVLMLQLFIYIFITNVRLGWRRWIPWLLNTVITAKDCTLDNKQ